MLWTNLKIVANKETLLILKMSLTLLFSPLIKERCKLKSKNKKFMICSKLRLSFGRSPALQKTCWQLISESILKRMRMSHPKTVMAAIKSWMIFKSEWCISRSIMRISRMISQFLLRRKVNSQYQTKELNQLKAFQLLREIQLMISLMSWGQSRRICLGKVI